MFARIKRIAPSRGWRALVGEVGIIVLGVLIAVGIGKAVEALDWRGRVADARSTLDDELASDVRYFVLERLRATPCLLRQLDRLHDAALHASNRQGDMPLYRSALGDRAYVHPTRPWSDDQWQAIVVDGVPSHMPIDVRRFYQDMFVRVRWIAALNMEETAATADLSLLAEPIVLDPAAHAALLRVIAQQRQRVLLIQLIASRAAQELKRSGSGAIDSADVDRESNTLRWCRANGLA